MDLTSKKHFIFRLMHSFDWCTLKRTQMLTNEFQTEFHFKIVDVLLT